MTPTVFVAATLAVATGSILQAASGVGAGFIIVPMLALIDLSLVPGPVVFGSLALSGIMLWRERGAVDRARLAPLLAGLALGALTGGWILATVPDERLGIVFCGVLLAAIGLSIGGLRVPLNRASAAAAGWLGGAMGASTGAGAAPLALLYQGEAGPRIRATLALLYSLASLFILATLVAFEEFGVAEARDGALLMPGNVLGYFIANRFRHRFEGRATRPVVLGIALAAAVLLIVRSLVGPR